MQILVRVLVVAVSLIVFHRGAAAECNCISVSVAADISGDLRAEAVQADNLYATGDYAAALAAYAKIYAKTKASALLYAQAQCYARMNKAAEAKAMFKSYLDAGAEASLKYAAEAKAELEDLDGGAIAGAGVVGATTGKVRGGAGAAVGAIGAGAGAAKAGVDTGVGAGANLAGSLRKKAEPPKVAKGAAMVLAVVAVAAIGAVGIQSISAAAKDDVDFDTKFNLSLGATGAVVGGTAIYLWGLTAAPSACAAGSLTSTPRKIITPVAHHGGGGVAAAFSF